MTAVEAHFASDSLRLYVNGHRLRLLWVAALLGWVCVAVDVVTSRRRDRRGRA